MQNNRDSDKPDQLEAELLTNLRLMTPEARKELLAVARLHAELFPLRPTLRLVKPGR